MTTDDVTGFESLSPSMYGEARTAYLYDGSLQRALGPNWETLLKLCKEQAEDILADPEEYGIESAEELEAFKKYGTLGSMAFEGSFFLVWPSEGENGWEVHGYIASGMGGYGGMWTCTLAGVWTDEESGEQSEDDREDS